MVDFRALWNRAQRMAASASPPNEATGTNGAGGGVGWFPSGGEQWVTTAWVLLGAFVGLWRAPLVLLVIGPIRLPVYVYASLSQESSFGAYGVGDAGDSIGPLQWNVTNDEWIDLDKRDDPFSAGYAVARHVQAAMLHSWWWWTLALPGIGVFVFRYLWTHGMSRASGRAAWYGDADGITLWGQMANEPRATRAYVSARIITIGPTLVAAWGLSRLVSRARLAVMALIPKKRRGRR